MMVDEVVADEVEEEVPSSEDEVIDLQSSNDATCDDENTAGTVAVMYMVFFPYNYAYIHRL